MSGRENSISVRWVLGRCCFTNPPLMSCWRIICAELSYPGGRFRLFLGGFHCCFLRNGQFAYNYQPTLVVARHKLHAHSLTFPVRGRFAVG